MNKTKKVKGLFKFKKSTPDLSDWGKHDDKLLLAIENGDLEKVDSILTKKGILPTKIGPDGISAFHMAAVRGNSQMVNLLLTHKADATTRDAQGRLPLHCAARAGSMEICERLLNVHNDCAALDNDSLTPLHHACLGGHIDCCRLLLGKMAPPNAPDKRGQTPLFIAAQSGHPAICRDLIENEAEINARDNEKCTPLMLAAKFGNRGVCEYLVRKGANVSLTDNQGHDVIWYAQNHDNAAFISIFENAPTRAAWTLETEQEDESIISDKELPSTRSELSSDVSADQPNGSVVQHEEDITSLEQVDVGIVPFHEEKDSSFEEVQTSFESDHREPLRQRHTPSSLASVSEEEEHRSRDQHTKTDTVNMEEFRELEEEHESLVQELERVNQEKRRLDEQVERLHQRWDEEAVKRKKNTNVDATTILEIEQELDGLKSDLDSERQKNVELEDQVQYYRKTYDIDSKPESERVDKDTWSDSDGELFDSPHAKEKDSKTVALLRSQIHSLNKENDALKETIQMCGGDGTGDTEINLRRRLTDIEAENARMTELLAEYEGLENEYHDIKRARSSTNEELDAVQEAKLQLQSKVTQLQQENDQVKDILANSLDKAGVTKEMRSLSAKIDELREENEVLKRKSIGSIEDLTKEVAFLSTKNSELESKYNVDNDDTWEEQMQELRSEITRLNTQINNLESENRNLHDSNRTSKRNPFEDNDDDREELFTYLQQTIADLQQENLQLKQGQFPAEFRAQEELKRLQMATSRMTEEKEALSQRLNSAMETLRRTQCELDVSEEQATSSSAEVQVTRTQLRDSQDRLANLVLKLQYAEENLDKERSIFQAERGNFSEECKRLQEELNNARLEASSQNNNTMAFSSNSDPDDNPIVHVIQLERDMYGNDKVKKEAVKRIGRHLTDIYSANENLKHQLAVSEETAQKDAEQIYQLQMQNISINQKLADEQQHRWKDQKQFQDLERQVESQSLSSIQSNSSWSNKNEKALELLVETLREENANLKQQIANIASRREALQTERDMFKNDKDRLQSEREHLQKELASSSGQRTNVNGQLQRLLFSVETLQTVSCSLSGHERKQYETDLEQLHGTLKSLLDGEVVPAGGDTEWTEEREQIWRHMRDEVIKMRQEHQATVDENEELLQEKERLAAELHTATEKHRAGERDLYHLHQDRIQMEEQVTLIKQLQEEISKLKEENKKSPIHIDTLQHELSRLQEDNNSMAIEVQNIQAQQQHSAEQYTTEIHQLREEKEQLRRLSESRDSPDKVARLQRDIHDLREENTQLSMQLDRRDSQQNSLMLSLQQEIRDRKERERQQEQQLADLSKHDRKLIDELQQQIVQFKEMNDSMKDELDNRKHQERSATDALQNDLSRMRQHNEGLRIELNSRHETIESLQREMQSLREHSQKLSSQLEGSAARDEAMLIKLQSEKNGLQQELKSLSERNTKLAIQLERRSSQDHQHMTQLQSELQAASAEKAQLQVEIRRQETEIRDLRVQLQKVPAGLNIDEVMKESAALKREIADLKQRDMMIVVTGQKGDTQLKEDFDYLSKQSDAMRGEMENLRSSLEQERQRSLQKLQVENDHLRSRLGAMEKEHKELRSSLLKLQNTSGVNGDESPLKTDKSLSRSSSDLERHCRLLQQENKDLHGKVKRLGQSQNRLEIKQLYEEIERLQRVTQSAEKILIKELGKLNPSLKSCCNLQELLSALEKTDLSRYSQDKEPSGSPSIARLQDDIRKLIRENEELRSETQRSKLKTRGMSEGSPDRQHQALQRQVARLQRQLEEADQRHREVVATYRTHLLGAMQGQMDGEVQQALKHIVKLRSSEQFC